MFLIPTAPRADIYLHTSITEHLDYVGPCKRITRIFFKSLPVFIGLYLITTISIHIFVCIAVTSQVIHISFITVNKDW